MLTLIDSAEVVDTQMFRELVQGWATLGTRNVHRLRPGLNSALRTKYSLDIWHIHIVTGDVIYQQGSIKRCVVDDQ